LLEQRDIDQAVVAYRESAAKAAEAAARVVLPDPVFVDFCTSDITCAHAREKSQMIPTGKRRDDRDSEFIYLFSLSEANEVGSQELKNAFKKGRRIQARTNYSGKRNLCQLNDDSAQSRTIYVGRSYSPRERFKQHLVASSVGTYAIHFQSWSSEIPLQVEFFCYQLSGIGDSEAQVIEDGLWDHLYPLLGKRGAR